MESPETRFERNGDIHLAYQTVGSGPLDLLLVDTWVHHVEAVWDLPDFARFLRRMGSFWTPDPLRPARHRPVGPKKAVPGLLSDVRGDRLDDAVALLCGHVFG